MHLSARPRIGFSSLKIDKLVGTCRTVLIGLSHLALTSPPRVHSEWVIHFRDQEDLSAPELAVQDLGAPDTSQLGAEQHRQIRRRVLAYALLGIVLVGSLVLAYTLPGPDTLLLFIIFSACILGALAALYYFAYRFYQDSFFLFLSLGWLANCIYLLFEFLFPSSRFDLPFSLKVYLLSLSSMSLFYVAPFFDLDVGLKRKELLVSTLSWLGWAVAFFSVGYYLLAQQWGTLSPDMKFMILSLGGIPFSTWILIRVAKGLSLRLIPEKKGHVEKLLPYTLYGYAALQPIYLLKLFPDLAWVVNLAFVVALLLKIANGILILNRVTSDSLTQAEAMRVRAELSRQSVLRDLGVLTAAIQHDIRNPLAVIQEDIKVMRKRFQAQPDVVADLKRIEEQGQRISAITKIIPLLRGGRDFYEPFIEKTSVGELVRRSIKAVQKELHTDNITFKADDRTVFIEAYRPVLEQAFVNILRNAVEAIHEARKESGLISVHFRLDHGSDRVRIEFTDNGCGIPPEHLPLLSKTLFTTRKNRKANSGVGLFISDRILRIHNGDMSFRSEPGHGTTVTVRLPKWNVKKE